MPRQQVDTSTITCMQLDCLYTISRVYRVLSHQLQAFLELRLKRLPSCPVSQVIISGNQGIDGFHQYSRTFTPSSQWYLLDGGGLRSPYGWVTQQVHQQVYLCKPLRCNHIHIATLASSFFHCTKYHKVCVKYPLHI